MSKLGPLSRRWSSSTLPFGYPCIGGPFKSGFRRVELMTTLDGGSRERVEAVAEAVLPVQLLDVRARTRNAVWEIADRIAPGMPEEAGRKLAAEVLRNAGLRKGWHKIVVRFGPNTTKNFDDMSDPGVVLGDDDIFFLDIGPIYEGCEGDAGDTFAVGADREMIKAAADVKSIWTATRQRWLDEGLTGVALYRFAEDTAQELGWRLNLELTGHRLSEFPHDAHYDGTLNTVDFRPSALRWMLEIQIRHPERNFGAFFEDLLVEDDRLQAESLPSSLP
jgi:methionyl aminopeptidase